MLVYAIRRRVEDFIVKYFYAILCEYSNKIPIVGIIKDYSIKLIVK